ncbi:protein kinase [Streptomyces sp. NPDC002845]
MDDYAGRVLADRYRLPLPPSDEYELAEARAFDTYSGQEVLVRQVPLPEVVEAEVLDADGLPDGFVARDGRARGAAGARTTATRRPADPAVRRAIEAAQAAAQVPDHPRLDQVFDVFAEAGSLWIVSELVAARPLAALLAEKPLTPYRAAEVAADVLTALRALHAHGWVHRNITARTVLVCDDGRVVLTGLAAGAAEEALCGYDPVPVGEFEQDCGSGSGGEAGVPGGGPGGSRAVGLSGAQGAQGVSPAGTASDGDPEAARRAAIEARAGSTGAVVDPSAGRRALEAGPGNDVRAARAGAIAAYRAGARAAARVHEEQRGGPGAALPAQRPRPEVTAGNSEATASADGQRAPQTPPGQIADPYGVARTNPWHGALPRSGAPTTDGNGRHDQGPSALADGTIGIPDAGDETADGLYQGNSGYGVGAPGASGAGVSAGGLGGGAGYGSSGTGATIDGLGPGNSGYGVGAPGAGASAGGLGGGAGYGGSGTGATADGLGPGDSGHGGDVPGATVSGLRGDAGYGAGASGNPGTGAGIQADGMPGGATPGDGTSAPGDHPAHGSGGPPSTAHWDQLVTAPSAAAPRRGPTTALAAERARQARMAVVGPVTERWAPEQAGPVHENWQLAAPIGPATDLWALGALLFRAVQGHAPYPEENTAELVQMVCSEPPAFAEECGPLRPVVESLLRQDPTERLDFEELRGWLRSLVRSAPEPEAGANVVSAPPVDLRPGDPNRLPIVRRRGELVRRRRAGLPATSPHARHKRAKRENQPRRLGRTLLLLILLGLAATVAYAMAFMPKAEPSGSSSTGSRTEAEGAGVGGDASGAPEASSEPRPDQTSPADDTGEASPSQSSSATEPQGNDPEVAQGFTLRDDTEGFRVAVANGWDRTPRNNAGQVVYSQGSFALIVVPGRDSAATYGSDPLEYQREDERELQPFRDSTWATSTGMRLIEVGGLTMAEGQFTWQDSAGRGIYVRNLAILIDGRYHVVQVRGPEAERDEVTRLFEQASATYQVTG